MLMTKPLPSNVASIRTLPARSSSEIVTQTNPLLKHRQSTRKQATALLIILSTMRLAEEY